MEILGKNKVKKERYVDVTLYKFSQAHEVLKKKQGIQKKIKRLYTIYNFFKKAHEIKKKKKRVYRKNKKDYIQFIIFLKKHMKFFLKKKGYIDK